MLCACRDESAKVDKVGKNVVTECPDTRIVAHQTGGLIPALVEIACPCRPTR